MNKESSYSTIDSTLIQLIDDIDFVYDDLTTNLNWYLSVRELNNLKDRLLSGFYTPSPIRLMKMDDQNINLYEEMLDYYPDYILCSNRSFKFVFLPSNRGDFLVFMGLSVMLHRLYYGSLPIRKKGFDYRLINRYDEFVSGINNMGKVTELFRIEYDLQYIDSCIVLEGVKSLVGADSFCLKLVSSFMDIAIVDEKGEPIRLLACMPYIGDLTWVLFHIALKELDSQIYNKYPGVLYQRYKDKIILASNNDDVIIDEFYLWDILENLLSGGFTLEYTRPGGEPIECGDKMIVLDNDGKVVVYDDP